MRPVINYALLLRKIGAKCVSGLLITGNSCTFQSPNESRRDVRKGSLKCRMGSSGVFIEFRQVDVSYPNGVTAFRAVDLLVEQGEFLFLVGKTGAGKSTLLKLLTREVKESSGTITLGGQNLSKLADSAVPYLRRRMGIVPQDFALLPKKRVWENVAYAMRAVGATKREVRTRMPEILDQVNIGHRADAFPHQLSGGEQQRVAIARAIIKKPPLILADEPTGNLDPEHSMEIMEILLRLNQNGTTVLVASHDMMVVDQLGQRTIRLEAGQVVSDEAKRGDVR